MSIISFNTRLKSEAADACWHPLWPAHESACSTNHSSMIIVNFIFFVIMQHKVCRIMSSMIMSSSACQIGSDLLEAYLTYMHKT